MPAKPEITSVATGLTEILDKLKNQELYWWTHLSFSPSSFQEGYGAFRNDLIQHIRQAFLTVGLRSKKKIFDSTKLIESKFSNVVNVVFELGGDIAYVSESRRECNWTLVVRDDAALVLTEESDVETRYNLVTLNKIYYDKVSEMLI